MSARKIPFEIRWKKLPGGSAEMTTPILDQYALLTFGAEVHRMCGQHEVAAGFTDQRRRMRRKARGPKPKPRRINGRLRRKA